MPNGTPVSNTRAGIFPRIESRRVAAFDAAVLNGVQHLQRPDDLTGRKHLDLKTSLGKLGDLLSDRGRPAEDGIKRLWEARLHPPAHARLCLSDRRSSEARGCACQ